MRARTTIGLLLVALALGGYLVFVERQGLGREERARRERLALRIQARHVTALEIETEDLRVRAERAGNGWRLVLPVEAHADAVTIGRILAMMESLERRAVLSRAEREREGLGLEGFGLDRPRARFVVEEPGAVHAFLLGRPSAVGDSVYLLDEATEDVVAVPARVAGSIPGRIEALRDRTLLAFDPARARRVDLHRPDGFVQLERAGHDAWHMVQPVDAPADGGMARALLALLAGTRADGFVRDGHGEDAMYGFEETGVSVTVMADRAEGGAAQTLEIGRAMEADPERRYARIRSTAGIYAVANALHDQLRMPADAFRDRRVFPYALADVEGFTLQTRDGPLTIRRANGGWDLVEPAETPADTERVEAFLQAWLDTRAERFLPPDDEPPHEPARRLVLRRRPDPSAAPDAAPAEHGYAIGPPAPDGLIPLHGPGGRPGAAVHPLQFRGFTSDPLAFAANRPLRVPGDRVAGFTVRHGERTWTVTHEGDEAPGLTVDGEAVPVDPIAAMHRLNLLARLPAARFLSMPPDPDGEYGLDPPPTTVRIHGPNAAETGHTLLLGGRVEGGVAARVAAYGLVFAVDPLVAELLRTPPTADGAP